MQSERVPDALRDRDQHQRDPERCESDGYLRTICLIGDVVAGSSPSPVRAGY